MRIVDPSQWRTEALAAHADGYVQFGLLAGVDRAELTEVILRVLHPQTGEALMLSTTVDDSIDSIADHFEGARWAERELAEQFGVRIEGASDTRPLLLREIPSVPPMRKDAHLTARSARTWPGDAQQEGANRRRQRPIGVPDA